MGLFQQAYETYDNNLDQVGLYSEGQEPLAPIGHIITSASIEITIDADGNFLSAAARDKKAPKIIIPVTEASAGRSGTKLPPHPLCEQVKYLADFDSRSHQDREAYLARLLDWAESEHTSSLIQAVYQYVSRNTLLTDLEQAGLVRMEKGRPKEEKELVAWRVLVDEEEPRVWANTGLMQCYTAYYLERIADRKKVPCIVTGEMLPAAQQHLKGVFSLNGNAKIISSNDSINFTYRGRFMDPEEALSISYLASQKAHNALKWLVSNQAKVIGGRAFLCWCPQGDRIPAVTNSVLYDYFGVNSPSTTSQYDYRYQLEKALMGYRSSLKDHMRAGTSSGGISQTVAACFDAATTGRLALTFYSEMPTETYLRKLEQWDLSCSWWNAGGNIMSPSLPRIAEYAFGTERDRTGEGKVETDDRIRRQAVERLVRCRLSEAPFPEDVERRLVQNASVLMNYGRMTRKTLLSTACAVIRKYHCDHGKEEFAMSLEKDRPDRSYQFGRLLAVYEKVERDTYSAEEAGSRDPNAIRLQSVYCNQPMHYAAELDRQMERAYFPRLSNGSQIFYKNLIGEIMAMISEFPEETWNKPLADTYLMGYYLQRRELYTKKSEKEDKEG